MSMGVTGSVADMVANTVPTNIDLDEFWGNSTPAKNFAVATAVFNRILSNTNVTYTVVTSSITDGKIKFMCWWRPMLSGSRMVVLTTGAA